MSRVCYGYKSASDVFYLQNGFYRFNGKLKQCPYESISACNMKYSSHVGLKNYQQN